MLVFKKPLPELSRNKRVPAPIPTLIPWPTPGLVSLSHTYSSPPASSLPLLLCIRLPPFPLELAVAVEEARRPPLFPDGPPSSSPSTLPSSPPDPVIEAVVEKAGVGKVAAGGYAPSALFFILLNAIGTSCGLGTGTYNLYRCWF